MNPVLDRLGYTYMYISMYVSKQVPVRPLHPTDSKRPKRALVFYSQNIIFGNMISQPHPVGASDQNVPDFHFFYRCSCHFRFIFMLKFVWADWRLSGASGRGSFQDSHCRV
jgi:hypothetical protein